ncbi:MAG: Unknown protein [uncultured Thiotrichaceae bacterium]|uniref:Acyltransferase 3 domain-containing protein n=1 Tax=uncultured Thiotrichaceae bacterium TaxID=298394 RepID=A0A6S6SQZ0_9GAMM|nr:MAG: Unknown protein [uncultured Thiotrichaceae bacterium]
MYRSLQAGRAIAALLVVLYHIGMDMSLEKYFNMPAFDVPFSFGGAGVEFFFVLSGFIIFYAHRNDFDQPDRVKGYFFKRFARIYPTFWIIFLGVSILALISASTRSVIPTDPIILLKTFLLIPQDPAIVGGTGAPVIGVAWTLQYEMLFYVTFALAIWNRVFGLLAIATFVVIYFIQQFSGNLPFPLSFLAKDYVWLFLMGMVVAKLCLNKNLKVKQPEYFTIIGGLIFLLVALDIVFEKNILKDYKILLFGLSSSIIVFGLVKAEQAGKVFLGNKFVQLMGNASYALYLTHYSLISFMLKVAMLLKLNELGLAGALITYVGMLVVCIVVAIGFHVWIEKPIARKLRAMAKKRKTNNMAANSY